MKKVYVKECVVLAIEYMPPHTNIPNESVDLTDAHCIEVSDETEVQVGWSVGLKENTQWVFVDLNNLPPQ